MLASAYLNTNKVKKILSTKPGEEGFSLIELVVVIAVLAILSAVAIPAFQGVQANGKASAVKNALVNGVKECSVKDADGASTAFDQAQSFKGTLNGYTIGKNQNKDSCFEAVGTASDSTNYANFIIALNPTTGVTTKTCTSSGKPGCPTSLSW